MACPTFLALPAHIETRLVQVFEGKVVDIGLKDIMVEVVGPESKIDAFLLIVKPYGIKEMARTGRLAMARGSAMEGREIA